MATTILITGATGKQGKSVINALLSSPQSPDITIYALTRNPDSISAKSLVSKSPETIKLIKGDLDDCPTIFTSIGVPIKAVFCVSVPAVGFGSREGSEETQGKALIDEALYSGVEHVVFTSVDRGSDPENINVPHFISKAKIEAHLKDKTEGTKMTWTILRPTAFMDNITTGFAGKIFGTAWQAGLSPNTKLQLVATEDIGYFGARALLDQNRYKERVISLAGDELTFKEANEVFKEETGRDIPVTYSFIGTFLLWAIKGVGLMFRFFEEKGYTADIGALKKEYPGLKSFRDWVRTSWSDKKNV